MPRCSRASLIKIDKASKRKIWPLWRPCLIQFNKHLLLSLPPRSSRNLFSGGGEGGGGGRFFCPSSLYVSTSASASLLCSSENSTSSNNIPTSGTVKFAEIYPHFKIIHDALAEPYRKYTGVTCLYTIQAWHIWVPPYFLF